MTCSVDNLQHMRWFINGTAVYTYVYSSGDESRTPFSIHDDLVMVEIVNVTQSTVDLDRFTAVSTLITTLSTLRRNLNVLSMQCGSREALSEIIPVSYRILGQL